MITIITNIDVSTAQLGDVAIAFAESGGYTNWALLDSYKPSRWDDIEVDEDFVFYTIEYENPNDDNPPRLRTDITPLLLAEGISRLSRTQALPADGIEYMDAAEADLVVQYAIFGEEVFA